jgi:hypothetical protein
LNASTGDNSATGTYHKSIQLRKRVADIEHLLVQGKYGLLDIKGELGLVNVLGGRYKGYQSLPLARKIFRLTVDTKRQSLATQGKDNRVFQVLKVTVCECHDVRGHGWSVLELGDLPFTILQVREQGFVARIAF